MTHLIFCGLEVRDSGPVRNSVFEYRTEQWAGFVPQRTE